MFKKVLIFSSIFLLVIFFYVSFMYFQGSRSTSSPEVLKPKLAMKLPGNHFALMNAEYIFMKTRDPNTGELPVNIKSKELAFASRLPVSKSSQRDQDWEWRGPENAAGRMLCMAFDVDNENNILSGSASGGMWRSTDQAQNWEKVTAPNVEQSATCLTQDTRSGKHHIWYYGTGELLSTTNRNVSTNIRTIGTGNGIFKSTDNGETWFPLESTQGGSPGLLLDIFQGIWNIVSDPVTMDKDIVYAACYGAIMRSEDGGNTWSLTLGDLNAKSFATDVVCTSDGVLYAALSSYCWSPDRPQKAGIWRSVDGLSWTNITPDNFPPQTRVMKLAVAPSNENIVYLVTETASDTLVPFSGIFNTENTFWKYNYNPISDLGVWEDRTQFMPGGGDGNFTSYPNAFIVYGGYTITLNVKPDDENVVFLAGMELFRSTTGFADTLHTSWMGGYPFDMDSIHQLHPDNHDIAFLPSDPDILFMCNDGGIQKTENCMVTPTYWDRMNNRLVTSQFYSVCVDHAAVGDDYILGGLQDNNWYYTATDNVAQFWVSIDICYDGFATVIADNREYCALSAYSGNIWTSLFDEQMNTKDIFYQLPDTLLKYYNPLMGSNPIFPFYQNFILDPNDNKTFYLPTKKSMWRKFDLKAAAHDTNLRNVGWEHLSHVDVGEASQITIVSVSKNPANRLFYGTDLGKVFRLDEAHTGNPVPVEITGENFPLNAYIACIDVDPENADNLVVVFSNYSVMSIFQSQDGGTTWTAQGGNLEEYPDGSGSGPSVRWVEKLTSQGHTVYFAGTSVGLFSTTEMKGDSTIWAQEGNENIGNVIIDMVDARQTDGFVAIATHGNGVYSTYYNPAAAIDEDDISQNPHHLKVFPNPSNGNVTISFNVTEPCHIELTIYNTAGKAVSHLMSKDVNKGQLSLSYDLRNLTDGLYFVTLKTGKGSYSGKLVIRKTGR